MKAAPLAARWVRFSFASVSLALTLGLAACGGGNPSAEGDGNSAPKKAISAVNTASSASVIAVTKVSETRVSRTVYDYVFKVTVQNGNLAQIGILANLTAVGSGTTIVDGSVVVGEIAANAAATPTDTITLRHDRAFSFDQAALRWNVTSTASAGTLADARLVNVGVGASADGNIYAIAGADLNNPVTLAIDSSSPGDQFNLLMSCGAPKLSVANPDNAWRLIGKGTDMVAGLPIDGCLRIVNLTAGKFIDIAIKVIPVAPAKTATVTIAPMGSASYTTSSGYLVEFAGNTSGVAIIANVFEAILQDGSLKLIVTFNTDVKNAGLTIRLPNMNAPPVARAALAARKSLAASSNTALSTGANLVAYPNDNENLGSKWTRFTAWTDETALRIPDTVVQNGQRVIVRDLGLLIVPRIQNQFLPSMMTIHGNREVSALYSVLPAESQIRPADEEVVIFINGFYPEVDLRLLSDPNYLLHIGPVKIGGGKDTWGEFPRLAMESRLFGGKQLIPFEFRWATNARFADVADDLAKSINLIKGSLGAQRKIHLVAHSFGGLVVRTLLQGKSINNAAIDTVNAVYSVTSVLTLGTPHSGIQKKLPNSFLPDGQDSSGVLSTPVLNINVCKQASCHEAGIEDAIDDRQKAILYGNSTEQVPEYSPGWLPIKLAAVDAPLPNIDFYVGIGLRATSTLGDAGDTLISFDGQRFNPQSRALLGFLNGNTQAAYGARVFESLIGAPLGPIISPPFFPLIFTGARNSGYAHQARLPQGFSVTDGDGWGLEAKIETGNPVAGTIGDCGVGKENSCEHGSLLLLRKMLMPTVPTISTLTPTTMVANGVNQSISIGGSNILTNTVIQLRSQARTGGNWVTTPNVDPSNVDFGLQQITYMLNPGTVADSVGIRVCRAGYVITDSDCSAGQTITITAPGTLSAIFLDDFNGTVLDPTKWNPLNWTGGTGFPYGLPTVGNGLVHLANCQGINTAGKVTFNGSKIVIESRFAGQKTWGRDSSVALVDPTTGYEFLFHDTNYQGWGQTIQLLKNGIGEFIGVYGGTTNAFKEYRITLQGANVTVERGTTIATLNEKFSVVLPRSVTNGTYYLRLGTGGCDGFYSPADFDWIRVNTY